MIMGPILIKATPVAFNFLLQKCGGGGGGRKSELQTGLHVIGFRLTFAITNAEKAGLVRAALSLHFSSFF